MHFKIIHRSTRAVACALAALLLAPLAAHAQVPAGSAGKVLLVIGGASIERGQTSVAAQRGALLQPGDTLVTSLAGRMHVRMKDGAMIALKPDTRFSIEQYTLGDDDDASGDAGTSVTRPDSSPVVARDNGLAVMSLLRGGFRTLTGLIGRRDRGAYSVKTPVATIGIRGTDYTAYYCGAGQCGGGEGLHLGVWDGGVSMSNDGGTQDFNAGEFGYVPNNNTRPAKAEASPLVAADSPPILVDEEGEEDSGSEETDRGGETVAESPQRDTGDGDDLGPELRPVEPDPVPDDGQQATTRSVSYAYAEGEFGRFNGNDSTSNVQQDPNGNLTQFDDTETSSSSEQGGEPETFGQVYNIGTASNVNQGTDPNTGIQWGRWTGGTAQITFLENGETFDGEIDLTDASLHYVTGPAIAQEPAFQITGSASFNLVGNTDPTDNLGNVGVLGDASLFVDFTNQTVDQSVELNINQQVWNAFGTGALSSGNALFSGQYNTVQVDGVSPTGSGGEFAGFLASPGQGGVPQGAGLTYNLSDGGGTDVTGSAVFGLDSASGGSPSTAP